MVVFKVVSLTSLTLDMCPSMCYMLLKSPKISLNYFLSTIMNQIIFNCVFFGHSPEKSKFMCEGSRAGVNAFSKLNPRIARI